MQDVRCMRCSRARRERSRSGTSPAGGLRWRVLPEQTTSRLRLLRLLAHGCVSVLEWPRWGNFRPSWSEIHRALYSTQWFFDLLAGCTWLRTEPRLWWLLVEGRWGGGEGKLGRRWLVLVVGWCSSEHRQECLCHLRLAVRSARAC